MDQADIEEASVVGKAVDINMAETEWDEGAVDINMAETEWDEGHS